MINTVTATDNDERVGYASQAGGNIEIKIWKKDSEIYLEWISALTRSHLSMKMTDDNKTEGTIGGFQTAHGQAGISGRAVPPQSFTFEKLRAKEVK